MPPSWIQLPAAAALLRSCAKCPPPTRTVRADHGGYEPRYCSTVGPDADRRVAELRRLHEAEWTRLVAAYDAGQASKTACRDHARLDVQSAIRAAIEGTQLLDAAE